MSSRTIGFAVAEEDLERLGRLTEKFGKGNRSAFLREAMRQMETVERWRLLLDILTASGSSLVMRRAPTVSHQCQMKKVRCYTDFFTIVDQGG